MIGRLGTLALHDSHIGVKLGASIERQLSTEDVKNEGPKVEHVARRSVFAHGNLFAVILRPLLRIENLGGGNIACYCPVCRHVDVVGDTSKQGFKAEIRDHGMPIVVHKHAAERQAAMDKRWGLRVKEAESAGHILEL